MEQVASDNVKHRRTNSRPQHAFHDPDSLATLAVPEKPAADALSVRQGALSAGSDKAVWQQPHVLMGVGCVCLFLLMIFYVSR